MEWIRIQDERPSNNEEVLVYLNDDFSIMTYEEGVDGKYYSFVEEGEIYYPKFWARLTAPLFGTSTKQVRPPTTEFN